jgi:CRISPR-associated exonuclease Cas4
MLLIIPIALLLILLGLWLQRRSRQLHQRLGLPQGEIVYSDTGTWQAISEPLLSRRYGLVGKPDYLVVIKMGGGEQTVPVEVKSGNHVQQPRAGHILQLGAYCLLVEDKMGKRPPYGLLHYGDGTLQIPYTDALRTEVLAAIGAIQSAADASDLPRNHHEVARCQSCSYLHGCGKAALASTTAKTRSH